MGTTNGGDDRNVCMQLAAALQDRYGFWHDDEATVQGRFVHRHDGQHSVVVSVKPWSDAPKGSEHRVRASFGVVRRDVNMLWAEFDPRITPYFPLQESGALPFCDHARGSWFHPDDPPSDVEAWVDQWVPRLMTDVPSFQFIQDYVRRAGSPDVVGPIAAENFLNTAKLFIMYDHMLTGWTDEDHERFMVPRLLDLDRYDGKARERVQRDIDALQSWIDAHPNGIERVLVD